jgi:osmoprotectant transport system substrate-binding protein
MREEDAQRAHVKTISEAASYPSGWVIGVGREFVYRKDGLQGLVNTYGLPLKAPVLTVPSPNDLYKSLVEKRVDMVVGSMTDPFIDILGLTVLDDDRKYFPQYDAALVVRTACLNSHPHLREALEKLSGKISDEEMRTMNHEVLSSSAEAVAKSFLLRTQLIK